MMNLDCFLIYQLKNRFQLMESHSQPTSYQDLLKHFQQAENNPPTNRIQKVAESKSQKLIYRPLHLKHQTKHNKQNLVTSKSHTQSVHQKSTTFRSEWSEDDVLKEYNQKRKEKQLEFSYNKFIAYITNILSSLTGAVPPQLLTMKITYLQFLAALKEMSMIKDNYQPSPNDCVSSLWHQLANNGQTSGVLILLVAGILNMRKNDEENSKYSNLSKKYAELRYTRMEMDGKVKTLQEEEQFPFAPAISQRSRTLAGSRSKSKNKHSKCFAQQSLLLEEENPPFENDHYPQQGTLIGNRRSEILYKLAKEKSLEKKRDKKSSEVQYEKSIKELTFHPKIHPNTGKKRSTKAIQGQQDSINRIIRGRIEREVRKIINQKGLPYNQKLFEKMKRERYEVLQKQKKNECNHHRSHLHTDNEIENTRKSEKEEVREEEIEVKEKTEQKKKTEPIVLTIQVDEDRCQKLIIEDPSRYKEAAAKFVKDLDLKPEMYDKLIEGVQKALKFQLTQVDEDSCESQYDSAD